MYGDIAKYWSVKVFIHKNTVVSKEKEKVRQSLLGIPKLNCSNKDPDTTSPKIHLFYN